MEIVLLLLFIVIELSLLLISAKKSGKNFRKERLVVNGAELVVFFLFLLLPGLSWSFRFYACAVVLAVRILYSLIRLLLKKQKSEYRFSWLASRCILSILILVISLLPAFIFTGYQGLETTGPYEVNMVKAILIDPSRTETFESDGSLREIPVYLYYPDNPDNSEKNNCPLVVFSHGAFGYYQSNTSTFMELASNGYVVASLEHPYHSLFTEDTEGKTIIADTDFISDVMEANNETVDEKTVESMSQEWIKLRTEDMAFALDQISQKNLNENWYIQDIETKPEIEKVLSMIDSDKIGLMGHSLGGASSVALGRSRNDIYAVADLDGTMLSEKSDCTETACTFNSDPYPVPLLSLHSESHQQVCNDPDLNYINQFVLDHAKEGYSTWFEKSAHMNFTDLPLFSPFLAYLLGSGETDPEYCIEKVNQVLLEFFNASLQKNGDFSPARPYA